MWVNQRLTALPCRAARVQLRRSYFINDHSRGNDESQWLHRVDISKDLGNPWKSKPGGRSVRNWARHMSQRVPACAVSCRTDPAWCCCVCGVRLILSKSSHSRVRSTLRGEEELLWLQVPGAWRRDITGTQSRLPLVPSKDQPGPGFPANGEPRSETEKSELVCVVEIVESSECISRHRGPGGVGCGERKWSDAPIAK